MIGLLLLTALVPPFLPVLQAGASIFLCLSIQHFRIAATKSISTAAGFRNFGLLLSWDSKTG